MKRQWTLFVVVVALVMTACSSEGGGDVATTTTATTAATGAVQAGDAGRGIVLYNTSCVACHGPDGVGVDGLGKPWVDSEFITSQTDAELIAFIKVGRSTSDPANTTGVDMPAKGGNPALDDEDLADLVAYMRTLN